MRTPDNPNGNLSTNRGAPGFLIVAPWEVAEHGGVNGVIRNLASRMLRDGQVKPLIIQNSWEHQRIEWATATAIPTASMRLRSPVPNDPNASILRALLVYLLSFPALIWALVGILKRYQVSVVDIHYPGLGATTFVLLKRLGLFKGQLFLSFHGSDLREGMALTGAQARQWQSLLRYADRIICVSRQLADSVASRFPWAAGKITVIHNGVDFSQFESIKRDTASLRKNSRVISVASFDRVKGVDILLQAIALVVRKYPQISFMLVGESGTEDEALRTLATKLGIDASIEWRRNVPHAEIPALLARADLFVLPSRNEGLGLALLEAGATGLPTVATCVGGTPEVIESGRNGLLVPSEDPDALANAILQMIEHSEQAVRMGQEFQQSVRRDFNWESACKRYTELTLGEP